MRGPENSQTARLPPRPPPSSDPGETFTTQPHAQEDRGYPQRIPEASNFGNPSRQIRRTGTSSSRRQVRIPPGQVREVTQGRPARRGASGSAPRALARPPGRRPPSLALQSPLRRLNFWGNHISKPWEFRTKPPSFLNLFAGMSSWEDKRGGCLVLCNVKSTDTQSSCNARPAPRPLVPTLRRPPFRHLRPPVLSQTPGEHGHSLTAQEKRNQ